MRQFRTLTATILLILGCASQPAPPHVAPAAETPLEVKLYLVGNSLQYFLSEPAYVALFDVGPPPEHRARLIYPCYPEGRARGAAGVNRVWGPGSRPQLFYTPGSRATSSVAQPEYLYMIASRSPLPLDLMERALFREPARFSVDDLSVRLASLDTLAVSGRGEEEWASDLFATQTSPDLTLPWQCVP